ncbi:MAG: hypothetical protein APF84_05455 [Gracilibacter sp. BRH_c7a]|nr:MAG: hypothetical protein APF84_05455 [Gracilibacter sp. BRH_c7a]
MAERSSVNLLFGVLFGFTLQRSRFCFVSCARDPVLFGNTRSVNALLLSLAIMTVAFPIIQNIQLQSIGKIVGQVHPVGIHTAVGALLFGFGMVIAGACASGTLMRVGEGYLMQVIVLIGFLIGVLLGVLNFGWWYDRFIAEAPVIYLPQYFGWIRAVIFQLGVLLVLYFFIKHYSSRKKIKI